MCTMACSRGRRLAGAGANAVPPLGARRPPVASTAPPERPAAGRQRRSLGPRRALRALADMARAPAAHGAAGPSPPRPGRDLAAAGLRGAGPAGLSAMPAPCSAKGLTWARPWLDQPREAIEAYVPAPSAAPYVDDPSNADPRFARSRLRQQVWPACSPGVCRRRTTLAAVARARRKPGLAPRWRAGPAAVADPGACRWRPGWLLRSTAAARGCVPGCRASCRAVPETLVQRLAAELPGAGTRALAGGQANCACMGGVLALPPRRPSRPGGREPAGWTSAAPAPARPAWGGTCGASRAERRRAGRRAARRRTAAAQGWRAVPAGPGGRAQPEEAVPGAGVPAWQRDGPLVWAGGRWCTCPAWASMRAAGAAGAAARAGCWVPTKPRRQGRTVAPG
jgi:tRNA(Ile)-lysidine synthase